MSRPISDCFFGKNIRVSSRGGRSEPDREPSKPSAPVFGGFGRGLRGAGEKPAQVPAFLGGESDEGQIALPEGGAQGEGANRGRRQEGAEGEGRLGPGPAPDHEEEADCRARGRGQEEGEDEPGQTQEGPQARRELHVSPAQPLDPADASVGPGSDPQESHPGQGTGRRYREAVPIEAAGEKPEGNESGRELVGNDAMLGVD